MMEVIKILAGPDLEQDRGFAWVEESDGNPSNIFSAQNHHEALGLLMMSLSCTHDLERSGVDLESVDMVPSSVKDVYELI